MTQTVFVDGKMKEVTPTEQLRIKRMALFEDLLSKLQRIEIRKRDIVESYKRDAKDIDDEINRVVPIKNNFIRKGRKGY